MELARMPFTNPILPVIILLGIFGQSVGADEARITAVPSTRSEDAAQADFFRQNPAFPRLSGMIGLYREFHMRSEITSASPWLSKDIKMLTIDEWLRGDDLRVKSYGLRKNLDLLLFGKTKETFDISEPYTCINDLPVFPGSTRPVGRASLLEFWSQPSALPVSLDALYYGPVSLWTLAERHPELVELVDSGESVADADSMGVEIWQVDSPVKTWSYRMRFQKMSTPSLDGRSMKSWHVLDQIIVNEQLDSLSHSARVIEIDVVSYRYQHDEMSDLFRLPVGAGCIRAQAVKGTAEDQLAADLTKSHSIWFEASMTIIESKIGAGNKYHLEKQNLPTISGKVAKSVGQTGSKMLDMHAFSQNLRFLDGIEKSTKLVYDRSSSLLFSMDQNSGRCKISSQIGNQLWTLDFSSQDDDKDRKITIEDSLLNMMLNPLNEKVYFRLLDEYTTGNSNVRVYESAERDFAVILSPTISGPASVIKRYEEPIESDLRRSARAPPVHKSVSIDILVFDAERSQVQAELRLEIRNAKNIGLDESFDEMNVVQCYMQGNADQDKQIGTFALDYDLQELNTEADSRQKIRKHFNEFKRQIVDSLISKVNLAPIQLDGSPRLEFMQHESQLRAVFSLTDPPTAIETGMTKLDGFKMSKKNEPKAELSLVHSINECSKICDKVDCLALSYCQDHTCRVLAKTDKQRRQGVQYSDVSKLMNASKDDKCAYYYTDFNRPESDASPKSVEQFERFMDSVVNLRVDKTALAQIATTYSGFQLPPVKFTRLNDDLASLKEDIVDEESMNGKSFKILAANKKIDMVKVKELQEDGEKYRLIVSHENYVPCLETCQSLHECVLVSYCRKVNTCLVFAGYGDVKRISTGRTGQSLMIDDSDCDTLMRDYATSYNKFINTPEPNIFEKKFANYSAQECAFMCEAANKNSSNANKCLSFDSCSIFDGEQQTESTCYLQKSHVLMDTFDRTALEPKWNTDSHITQKKIECNHYSRSSVNDYLKVQNKALKVSSNQTVRGLSEEKCALDCYLDFDCLAFEFCFNQKTRPSQACQFVRLGHLPTEIKDLELNSTFGIVKQLDKTLEASDKCSIYVLSRDLEFNGLDKKYHSVTLPDVERHGKVTYVFFVLLYVMVGVIVGLSIQFLFVKLRGRTITILDSRYLNTLI